MSDDDVLEYRDELHNNFVIVPIEKAANNISIICKRFYVTRLLKEVGALKDLDPTYEIQNIDLPEIVNKDIMLCERYGLKLEESKKTLPIMYWTPKMCYIPSKARFIVSSAKYSTKPISKVVSNAFKPIFNQIENFHNKSKFCKNINRFWVTNPGLS